jgi:hypothetical protein
MLAPMKQCYLFVFLLLPMLLSSQGSVIPIGTQTYDILDRLEIKSGINAPFHSALKYHQRGDIARYAMEVLETDSTIWSERDRQDLNYLLRDNNDFLIPSVYPTRLTGAREPAYQLVTDGETGRLKVDLVDPKDRPSASPYYETTGKPLFGIFYKTPAHLLEVDRPFFQLRVNPLLNFRVAKAEGDDSFLLMNQRGLELRGSIDDRIFFRTNVIENQARYPDYVTDRIEKDLAVPGAGFYKDYRSRIFDFDDGVDYLLSQGAVNFNVTRHVGVELGHGRHFIGNGYRSLLLSDFAANYFYLQLDWRVWKLQLRNVFAELALEGSRATSGDRLIPKKYFAAHYLSYKITPKIEVGLFETIVFSRNNQFELQYLNPVILYRTVEQLTGSPDNVLIGLQGKWNLFNQFQLYGQLMMDEFKFDELFLERRKWWGNKYGIQAGAKYIDAFGIDHLDLQAELNLVRPYTYAHRDSSATYSHYEQPLAHPLGANFQEYIFRLRYQPIQKLTFNLRYIHALTGENTDEFTNYGNDILIPTSNTKIEEGVIIGQGARAEIDIIGLDVSYALWHNLSLELEYFLRNKKSEVAALQNRTSYIGGGIRMNLERRNLDF